MKIAVINLATHPTRWSAVRQQFLEVGLEPTRVEAIDGKALSGRELDRLYSPATNRMCYHKPLQPGEIGCYASHIAVWRALLESNEARVAVFEDDVDIAPDLPQTLAAIAQAPPDWDLVKLLGRRHERTARRTPLLPGRDLVAYRRVPGLTCAYVISRRGAEKLLGSRIPFGRPIDVDLRHWWECDLRVLGVHPYPVCAAPSSLLSTIEGRRAKPDLATKWRKFLLQARYSLLNWKAVNLGVAASAPPRLGLPADLIDHPTR